MDVGETALCAVSRQFAVGAGRDVNYQSGLLEKKKIDQEMLRRAFPALAALAVGEVDVRPDTRIMDIGTETRRELIGVLAQIVANGAIEIKARRVL